MASTMKEPGKRMLKTSSVCFVVNGNHIELENGSKVIRTRFWVG
jgi:hypothetical protein